MADETPHSYTDIEGKPEYGLPHHEKEFGRLDLQHESIKLIFGGLNVCNEEVDQVLDPSGGEKRVLDIGSGSGVWCIEMAKRYPEASILGIDIKHLDLSNVPSNCRFETWDVNEGLEKYYGQFDLIHTRFTTGIFTDQQTAFARMERCLKPGGLFIFIAAGFFISEDRKTMYPLYTKANPRGSWCQRSLMEIYPGLKVMKFNPRAFNRQIDEGLWKHELLDPSTCAGAVITAPVGPWVDSPDPDEAARLKKIGEYWRDNVLIVQRHWERLNELAGRSEEWEVTVKNAEEELRETRHRMAMHLRAVWGRARGSNDALPTPLRPKTSEKPDKLFQVLSIHHSEEEWVRISEESRATITPEMESFLSVRNFDALT